MSYKRLTVEECAALSERHGFKFAFRSYGLAQSPNHKSHNCGCAVSMAILRHTDDMQKARDILHGQPIDTVFGFQRFSNIIGLPKQYLRGLVLGFEHGINPSDDDEYGVDHRNGVEDGTAIRKYVHELPAST